MSSIKKIILVVVALIVILVILYWLNLIPRSLFFKGSSTYQAVFLTNGQVYFGHLANWDNQYPDLTDVYYLQVSQPPQPIQSGQNQPTNINLVKLGGELHGPTDEMFINRNQILFVENLRPDSGVVKAIQQLNTVKK